MTTAIATTVHDDLVPPPATIDVAYVQALREYADLIMKGGLGGKDAKRMEVVAAKIEMGRHVGLNPFAAITQLAVINDRPTIYGDAVIGLVRRSGLLEDFEETVEGEGDALTAVCRVRRKGAKRDRVERFSVADAKRANLWGKKGPWQEYPRRMLMYRARGFCLRDEFADVLGGLVIYEEAADAPGEPRQEVPVSVVTVSHPPVANAPTTPTAAAITTTPVVRPEDDPSATRDRLLQRLAELRQSVLTGRGIPDDDTGGKLLAWADVLKPFGVAKAGELGDDKLRELAQALAKEYDPF